jgi:hypothetical protein
VTATNGSATITCTDCNPIGGPDFNSRTWPYAAGALTIEGVSYTVTSALPYSTITSTQATATISPVYAGTTGTHTWTFQGSEHSLYAQGNILLDTTQDQYPLPDAGGGHGVLIVTECVSNANLYSMWIRGAATPLTDGSQTRAGYCIDGSGVLHVKDSTGADLDTMVLTAGANSGNRVIKGSIRNFGNITSDGFLTATGGGLFGGTTSFKSSVTATPSAYFIPFDDLTTHNNMYGTNAAANLILWQADDAGNWAYPHQLGAGGCVQATAGTGTVTATGVNCGATYTVTGGTATLASGTATVTSSASCAVGTGCVYKLTNCGLNGSTAVGVPVIGTVTAGTSFVINSESAAATVVTGDTSKVCWQIN